jgi:hypothetical protein
MYKQRDQIGVVNGEYLPCRFGAVDPRTAYHTETQLWPVGFGARTTIPDDPKHSRLLSKITPGGDEGPLFTISTKLPYGSSAEETVVWHLTCPLPNLHPRLACTPFCCTLEDQDLQ